MKSVLRRGADLIRLHRWIPGATALGSGLFFLFAVLDRMHPTWVLGSGGALLLASYVWGYSNRAMRDVLWPPLLNLQRRSYAAVWDSMAISKETAAAAVCGRADEDELRRSAAGTVRNLLELASVGPDDELLEIGCGVARIGLELAPHCRKWAGAEISANMVRLGSERVRGMANVHLVQLQDAGLSEFSEDSFDVVYATNMFPHIDEMDRWRYVEEAFRVLRPGGRIFVDSVDFESDAGWTMFANDARRFRNLARPPYMPRFSTASELTAYAIRAGFERVVAHRRSPLVIVVAVKPALREGRR